MVAVELLPDFTEEVIIMTFKTKSRVFSVVVFTIALGFLLFLASPSFSWQTKDPQLAEDFAKMLGFKVKDKVGKVAPEIKPGVVIDGANYKNYPGLVELLPKSLYDRLDPKAYAPLAPIKVKETDQYHASRGWMEKTILSGKTIKFAADGLTLEGYVGGYPFLHPKNGLELIQWADHPYIGDTFCMRPMRLRLYGRENKPEREIRQHLNWIHYMHRTDWGPEALPNNPEGIRFVTSGTFIYPKDIAGSSYVRKRFVLADKVDEFLLFLASMRRIRRMSGRDTQDPLFGSDLVWDDYNTFQQKLSNTDFPNDYKLLPAREMLLPTLVDYRWPNDRAAAGYTDYNVDESGDQTYLNYGSWQRRWVYPLEIVSKDASHCYSKRIWIADPELCVGMHMEAYDQAGRLWRTFTRDYNVGQGGEGLVEDLIDVPDYINHHRSIIDMKGEMNPKWLGPEYADVRFLSKKGKITQVGRLITIE